MYNLGDAYHIIGGHDEAGMWDGKIFCAKTDASASWLTSKLNDAVNCYSFNIVLKGHLKMISGTHEVEIGKNDLYTYMPGLPFRVLEISDDYQSICLLVDEHTAHDTQAFRKLIQTSHFPLTHFGVPVQPLTDHEANRLCQLMQLIHDHIVRESAFKYQALHMLLSVFMFDLEDIQQHAPRNRNISTRNEALFISFFTLLRDHFIEHRDIGFYADSLNISTTHLSRIVKQVNGSTVIGIIDQMLVMEATWLLSTTSLSVSQIADRLNFATTASFDKFFSRMKGISPSKYREQA